ncbi:MAG: sigma-70 family RNA polymerase sigma factor [Clostridia bacterium]|nr:sigma-70 family RNA polymerase sigma factor [Clostridia bacterium]
MVDVKSRDSFIESNLPLVHSLCKRFVGRGIEYDDLYQAGCIGLIKAADGFDNSRGLCFSTYAVPVILGEVRRMFRDGGAIKVSRSLKELSLKVAREKMRLENQLSREPTINELAVSLGVTPEEITEAQSAAMPTVSLTVENDDGIRELDVSVAGPEDSLIDKLLLERAFSYLDATEQQIIKYRYFQFLTQNETATRLGISQVQISRAEKKILQKLRNVIGSVA